MPLKVQSVVQIVAMQIPQLCHVPTEHESREVDAIIDRAIDIYDRIFDKLGDDETTPKGSPRNPQLLLHQCKIDNVYADEQPSWFPIEFMPPEGKLVIFQFAACEPSDHVLSIGYQQDCNYFNLDDKQFGVLPLYWLNIPPCPHVP
ncbi:hypothetical protein [Coleofasciculus sp.]|uniref:hypothetical protein n=1 Tax=Coleofasciculus sp. TaxID=3100458 RepID=UPI004062BDD4